MKFFSLIFATVALSSSLSLAQTVVCPDIASFTLNGQSAVVVYSPKMEFSNVNDTAQFAGENENGRSYRTSKWGALFTLPHELLNGSVKTADVIFFIPEMAPQSETCYLK